MLHITDNGETGSTIRLGANPGSRRDFVTNCAQAETLRSVRGGGFGGHAKAITARTDASADMANNHRSGGDGGGAAHLPA